MFPTRGALKGGIFVWKQVFRVEFHIFDFVFGELLLMFGGEKESWLFANVARVEDVLVSDGRSVGLEKTNGVSGRIFQIIWAVLELVGVFFLEKMKS